MRLKRLSLSIAISGVAILTLGSFVIYRHLHAKPNQSYSFTPILVKDKDTGKPVSGVTLHVLCLGSPYSAVIYSTDVAGVAKVPYYAVSTFVAITVSMPGYKSLSLALPKDKPEVFLEKTDHLIL